MENWNQEGSYISYVNMKTLYWCFTYCRSHPMSYVTIIKLISCQTKEFLGKSSDKKTTFHLELTILSFWLFSSRTSIQMSHFIQTNSKSMQVLFCFGITLNPKKQNTSCKSHNLVILILQFKNILGMSRSLIQTRCKLVQVLFFVLCNFQPKKLYNTTFIIHNLVILVFWLKNLNQNFTFFNGKKLKVSVGVFLFVMYWSRLECVSHHGNGCHQH